MHTTFAIPTTLPPTTTHNEDNKDDESSTLEVTTTSTSSALTPSPSTSEGASTEISKPQGRNIRFPSPYEDVVVLAPIQDSLDSTDYRKQIIGFEQPIPPYALGYDDAIDVVPTQYEYEPVVPDLRDRHAVVYPMQRFRDDMAVAESNIVFRPLFSYRRQTAQKRRVYTQPSYASSPSYSSTSSRGNAQRRGQGNRSPSYYAGYPNYYVNAQYDYVP